MHSMAQDEKLFLGVDTSNYTTSLALVCDGRVLANVRRLLPVADGACGLRQSDAVFLHTKALPELADELFSSVGYAPSLLSGVAVSVSPRDADGSYMPCFLAGLSFASAVSNALRLPLYRFSHQAGHIMAAVASSGASEAFAEDFLSFHVSGGTTEALYVHPSDTSFDVRIVGGTKDASAGQIIDRAGVRLGLSFPCGKALDELSEKSTEVIPPCVCGRDGAYFSLSGLQNRFEGYLTQGRAPADCAAFLFESLARTLNGSVEALRAAFGNRPVLLAGGVMSNRLIRARLAAADGIYFASRELSSDNACGTALLAERAHSRAM